MQDKRSRIDIREIDLDASQTRCEPRSGVGKRLHDGRGRNGDGVEKHALIVHRFIRAAQSAEGELMDVERVRLAGRVIKVPDLDRRLRPRVLFDPDVGLGTGAGRDRGRRRRRDCRTEPERMLEVGVRLRRRRFGFPFA
jgi:hypothetical protein